MRGGLPGSAWVLRIINRVSCRRPRAMTHGNRREDSKSPSKSIASEKRSPQRNSRHQSQRKSKSPRRSFWRDLGLSLVLASLFLLFLGGQTFSGWFHYNEELEEHQHPRIGIFEYVRTGAFGEAVFENWESEFLQMGLYVLLTTFLFQRGSAESRDPDESDKEESDSFDRQHSPLAARKAGLISKLYSHSLSIAFGLLFATSFAGHVFWGAKAYNVEAAENGQSAISV